MNFVLITLTILSSYLSAFAETKTHFPLYNDPIDVVIPSVEKDLDTLELCIKGIKKNGHNIRRVIVVSKRKLTDNAEWYSEDAYPFSFQDVAKALSNGDPQIEEDLFKYDSRTGWYFQQLLKLYAPLVIPNISSNVLILDSDTIFLNPVNFLNKKNGGMYNPGSEYHLPYFRHAEILVPGFFRLFPNHSGISHHMIFQKAVIDDLFCHVEMNHSGPFWKTFCQAVERKHLSHAGASEYEIYFNYVFSRTDQTSVRPLHWRNVRNFKELSSLKKKGLHYASIHTHDRDENTL